MLAANTQNAHQNTMGGGGGVKFVNSILKLPFEKYSITNTNSDSSWRIKEPEKKQKRKEIDIFCIIWLQVHSSVKILFLFHVILG